MYEYKVFKWRFDLSTADELEETLNEHAKEGWRVLNIIPHMKGSSLALFGNVDADDATIILEKNK